MSNLPEHIAPVPLPKAYRLLNHGPTVLVSARHDGRAGVMTAAWACALDLVPSRLTVVISKASATRRLLEASRRFAVQVPCAAQLQMVYALGTSSLATDPDKLAHCGAQLFELPEAQGAPLVQGCAAWLACRLLPEPHNQQAYDLFIGEVEAAWADTRAFAGGHWQFERTNPAWRSLHYVAGGRFYATGEALDVPGVGMED